MTRPRRTLAFAALLVGLACLAVGILSWDRYCDEEVRVAHLAGRILAAAGPTADEGERIRALSDHVIDTVAIDPRALVNRPVLRHSAAAVLEAGIGYCGERTRAMIALLRASGIRARRVVLHGEVGGRPRGHVLVEVDHLGRPVVLEVFRGVIPEARFLTLSIDAYLALPRCRDRWDAYSYFNIRRFRAFPGAGWLLPEHRTRPLPHRLAWLLESPRLLEATIASAAALPFLALGAGLLLGSRRGRSRKPPPPGRP